MKRADPPEEKAVAEVLRAAGLDPDLETAAVCHLLREGAGEETLLERLGPGNLPLVRDLLRIGVRPRERGWRKRKLGADVCTVCERSTPFCWSCRCGFRICQDCLEENRWGMTCNNITWECPDCGGMRSF